MDPNPFASAAERSIPEPRVDWSSLPRVAVVAVPVTVLASVPEIWLTQQVVGLPGLGTVASLIALLLAASGIAAFLGRRPRAALWPACLAFPLFLWSIDLQEPELETVLASIDTMALRLLWACTVGGLVTAVWLEVPLRRLIGFLAAVGLKTQAVTFGWQVLFPGLVLWLLLALFEVVAARDEPGSWVTGAVRAARRAPAAWAVTVVGQLVAFAASTTIPFAWGTEIGWQAVVLPTYDNLPLELAAAIPAALIYGATLAVAARLLPPVDQ